MVKVEVAVVIFIKLHLMARPVLQVSSVGEVYLSIVLLDPNRIEVGRQLDCESSRMENRLRLRSTCISIEGNSRSEFSSMNRINATDPAPLSGLLRKSRR